MTWFRFRRKGNHDVTQAKDSEALQAQERARLAQLHADEVLTEIKARSARSRRELATNNFAREIWQAMKRREP